MYSMRISCYFNNFNDYTQELDSSTLIILQVLNITKILFSGLFFSVSCLVIDIVLLIFIKKNLLELKTINYKETRKKIRNKSRFNDNIKRIKFFFLPYSFISDELLLIHLNI